VETCALPPTQRQDRLERGKDGTSDQVADCAIVIEGTILGGSSLVYMVRPKIIEADSQETVEFVFHAD